MDELRGEVETLRRGRGAAFEAPPLEWLEERIARLQEVLERRTAQSALLRKLLGQIQMQPVTPDVGRPYYRATTKLDVLAFVRTPVRILCDGGGGGSRTRPVVFL